MAAATMSVRITATGNAGVHVAAPTAGIFVDAFWDAAPRFLGGGRPWSAGRLAGNIILITHTHWDHFSPDRVAEAAARTGATVVGPAAVVRQLGGRVPDGAIASLEPPEQSRGRAAPHARLELPGATVTAFRTSHGRGHNSYLVEAGDFRFFHDGDNEDTRPLDIGAIAPVDALLLCPWKGSGWAEFVERLAPRQWLLIHLTEEEIAEHRAGRFLPDLCERVPLEDRTAALRPGETFTF